MVEFPDSKLKPRGIELFVLPLMAADRGEAGIIIPDAHRERPQSGIVWKVGPGLHGAETGRFVPVSSLPGEQIIYGAYAGKDFVLPDGLKILIIRDTEVLGALDAVDVEIIRHGEGWDKMHQAGLICEYCEVPKSAYLEEERARLLAEGHVRSGRRATDVLLQPLQQPPGLITDVKGTIQTTD